jgi:hypothetical protein
MDFSLLGMFAPLTSTFILVESLHKMVDTILESLNGGDAPDTPGPE